MLLRWTPTEVSEKLFEILEKKQDKEIIIEIVDKKSKRWRSIAQNNSFYKLFTDIWNHLWEDKEAVKEMLLAWIFWTTIKKLWIFEKDVNNEPKTSKLSIEQWKEFIDKTLAFVDKYQMPITLTSIEKQDLYNWYKK